MADVQEVSVLSMPRSPATVLSSVLLLVDEDLGGEGDRGCRADVQEVSVLSVLLAAC